MDKLKKLVSLCKCGVFLTVNEHRNYYMSSAEALEEAKTNGVLKKGEIQPEIEKKMIETNTIIRLQFYSDTPIGSYNIWHYDLDAALDEGLVCLSK